MLIAIKDNFHFKLGGMGDWFGIIGYWPLIAQLLLFGSFCAYHDHICLFGSIWMTLK